MRWLLLLLVAFAAWYGWRHYPEFLERRPRHEARIENRCNAVLESIRLVVDGQTLTEERLPAGGTTEFHFRVRRDASFELAWAWPGGSQTWTGGLVTTGPIVQRHVFQIDDRGRVLYRAEGR